MFSPIIRPLTWGQRLPAPPPPRQRISVSVPSVQSSREDSSQKRSSGAGDSTHMERASDHIPAPAVRTRSSQVPVKKPPSRVASTREPVAAISPERFASPCLLQPTTYSSTPSTGVHSTSIPAASWNLNVAAGAAFGQAVGVRLAASDKSDRPVSFSTRSRNS